MTAPEDGLRESERHLALLAWRSGDITMVELKKLLDALIKEEIVKGQIAELQGLSKAREFPVKNHGPIKDIYGNEAQLIQTATDSWENTIKLRVKALQQLIRKDKP